MVSFQLTFDSEEGTWYKKYYENYSVTSCIVIKDKVVKYEELNKRIEEIEKLLAVKQKLS